jgi:hypothetical protein
MFLPKVVVEVVLWLMLFLDWFWQDNNIALEDRQWKRHSIFLVVASTLNSSTLAP